MNEVEAMREQGDQIREVLSQLKALQVEEKVYLKLEDALDATRQILYPDGITIEDEYKRLVTICKAGCVAIGYSSQEITLLPPDVDFSERGVYLKKMPEITDKVIETLINGLAARNYEFISSPYIAITRNKITRRLAYQSYIQTWESLTVYLQRYLEQRCDKVAEKLGYELREFQDNPAWPAGEIGYAKVMIPDMDACKQALSDVVSDRKEIDLDDLIRVGLRAAFGMRVDKDPQQVIAHQTWIELFDQFGYIYDPQQHTLTPKPLNLPQNAYQLLARAIEQLPTYNHPQIGLVLIKDEVIKVARLIFGQSLTEVILSRLIADGIIGRVLIKLGYKLETLWFSRDDLKKAKMPEVLSEKWGVRVFTRAMQVSSDMETPALASGFRIHSPVLVRDKHTLVYMELLGPRQAVKANWAALRQNKSHYVHGLLYVEKEDKLTTLKTTLPCGWDHWCLIHRQASYEKLTPNSTFYLIDHSPCPSGPPSTFMAFLAKSLAIPILAEWAEYLWVEGRMKELITPLSKNCYGLGGWKVETSEWSKIISDGLADQKISF